jgi:hypothetical protein
VPGIEPAVKGLVTKIVAEAKAIFAEAPNHASDLDFHARLDAILSDSIELSGLQDHHREDCRVVILLFAPELVYVLSAISEAAETSYGRNRNDLVRLAQRIRDLLLKILNGRHTRTRPAVSKMEMNYAANRL